MPRFPPPLIAIAADITESPLNSGRLRIQCALAYANSVAEAGGIPCFLAPILDQIDTHLATFDGFVLTGGDDPRTEAFGEPTHPKATVMHPRRQEYETALIRGLLEQPDIPVFGICLGMQMLALVAGGRLDQHLPDSLGSADRHHRDAKHPVLPAVGSWLPAGEVTSHHRQAVIDPGSLQATARSADGVVEAVENPSARFCLGVQWHPERTTDPQLGPGLFRRFVAAAAQRRVERLAESARVRAG